MNVSIIIPTLNEEKNLERLLRSLKKQSFRDFELIVADAKSEDNTKGIAKQFGAKVVKGGRPGQGRNAGANVAKGDVFVFLDADVTLPNKHFLRDVLKEMRSRRLDVGGVQVNASDGSVTDRFMFWVYNLYIKSVESMNPHAAGACMIAKRHIHELLGGFDESVTLAEDCDYARRSAEVGQFGILRSQKILTSMRRHKKEGRGKMAVKYIATEAHIVKNGAVRENAVKYEFDHYK